MNKFVICVGVPRTATSFLYQLYRDCSNYSYTPVKESNFFVHNINISKNEINDYFELFEKRSDSFFECSPAYFSSYKALKSINKHLESPEIIFFTRNVKDRFISQYNHHLDKISQNFPTFESYCENAFIRSNDWFHPNYNLRCSNYLKAYKILNKIFPKDRVHHIRYEELGHDPENWIKKIEKISDCNFIGWNKKNKTNQSINKNTELIFTKRLEKRLEKFEKEFLEYTLCESKNIQ
jgi:hypothetical protein